MKKYVKKPLVIEAVQLTHENLVEVLQWCHGRSQSKDSNGKVDGIIIPTLEGDMQAPIGWWVICGIHGEYYACEPEIFAKTYEEVSQ